MAPVWERSQARSVNKRGLSILFITHDLSLANYISERAVILYRGCLVEMGAVEKKSAASVESRPQAAGLSSGCAYRDRCPLAFDKCAERPALVEIEPDHQAACWKAA